MEKHVEERFERIEKNLEAIVEIAKDAWTLCRQNQTQIEYLISCQDKNDTENKLIKEPEISV